MFKIVPDRPIKIRPVVGDYSWIGIANMVLFQWLFIRLEATLVSRENPTVHHLRFIGPILPLTGWWSDYRWLTRDGERPANQED